MRREMFSTLIAVLAVSAYALSSCALAGDTSHAWGRPSPSGTAWSNTPQSLTAPRDEAAVHPPTAPASGTPSTIAEIRSSHIPARVVADSEWSSAQARNVTGIGKGTISIHEGGVHRLSGVHRGQVHVKAPRGKNVVLLLDNFALTSQAPTALSIEADSAVIALSGNNTIRAGHGDDGAAGIAATTDLTVTGKGGLHLMTGRKVDGISTSGDLYISGAPLKVNAGGAGFRSSSSVHVHSATVDIASHGDGIAAVHPDNQGRGWVTISDNSALTVNAGPSGIFASTDIIFSGGEHSITARRSGLTTGRNIGLDGANIGINASSRAIKGKGHFLAASGKVMVTIPHNVKSEPIDIEGEVLTKGASVSINGQAAPSSSRSRGASQGTSR